MSGTAVTPIQTLVNVYVCESQELSIYMSIENMQAMYLYQRRSQVFREGGGGYSVEVGSMHKHAQTRGYGGMLPQENLQPLRLFLVSSETASGTNYHEWALLHTCTITLTTPTYVDHELGHQQVNSANKVRLRVEWQASCDDGVYSLLHVYTE